MAGLKSRCELCAGLLLVGAWRHYGWALFDGPTRALVSKASGAAAICFLLWIVWKHAGTKWALPVFLWWAWEETQVVLCSVWFIHAPWPIEPGQAMCSAKAGFDIGALGIVFVAVLAFRLTLSGFTGIQNKERIGK